MEPQGVLDLLGLIAYAQLVAFFRLSDDAALAPTLADKAALAEMAVAELGASSCSGAGSRRWAPTSARP